MNEALADSACPSDITILEGHRGEERQNQMVAEGKSQLRWPRSKHYYHPLADHIKATWSRLQAEGKVVGNLEWGGDWRFQDGPHWQINR
jgi:hypothetical protein